MMLTKMIPLIFVLGLGACATTDWNQVEAQAEARADACHAQNSDEVLAAKCSIAAAHEVYAAANFPYMDILDQANAHLLLIHEQHAAGQLSDDQFNAARADIGTQYANQISQRRANEAARAAAVFPPTIVCNTIGTTVICN